MAAIRAGELSELNDPTTNSMANEIYKALAGEIPLAEGENVLYRQKLCLAIARGVIEHLRQNQDALVVRVPAGSRTRTSHVEVTP